MVSNNQSEVILQPLLLSVGDRLCLNSYCNIVAVRRFYISLIVSKSAGVLFNLFTQGISSYFTAFLFSIML